MCVLSMDKFVLQESLAGRAGQGGYSRGYMALPHLHNTFKRSPDLATFHLTGSSRRKMKFLTIISLVLTLLGHSQGKVWAGVLSLWYLILSGELLTSQPGDAEVSLPDYGYILPPQLLYNAMKRNLQKKSKEKHRMLFTRMGRSGSFYPALEEMESFWGVVWFKHWQTRWGMTTMYCILFQNINVISL